MACRAAGQPDSGAPGNVPRELCAVVAGFAEPLFAGSQTSVTVIRNLALGEIELRDWPRVLIKEIGVAVVSGAALALVNFLRIIIFTNTSMMIAAVVSVTLFCTVIIAMIVGCLLPIGAKKLGFDPAVMASPMITTIVDACSLMIYFLIASTMLGL